MARSRDGRETMPVKRCPWCEGVSDAYRTYHDEEWGVPVRDDRTQFEFLTLESAQAGLSWSTVLHKRVGYRRAFTGFDPVRVSRFFREKNRVADCESTDHSQSTENPLRRHECPGVPGNPGGVRELFRLYLGLRRRHADPESLAAAVGRARDLAGVRCAQPGSEKARLQVCRQHDHVRAHAGDRSRERSPGRLLSPRGMRGAQFLTSISVTSSGGSRPSL